MLHDLKVMATDLFSIGMDLDMALDWVSTSGGKPRVTRRMSGAIVGDLSQERLLKVLRF